MIFSGCKSTFSTFGKDFNNNNDNNFGHNSREVTFSFRYVPTGLTVQARTALIKHYTQMSPISDSPDAGVEAAACLEIPLPLGNRPEYQAAAVSLSVEDSRSA